MRDIHIGKRGPEVAGEEQPDKLRKTVRFDQEASGSSAVASSEPSAALEYPASGGTRVGRSPYLCMLMTTYNFPRWMHLMRWMDESVATSEKCWDGIEEKMREISREVS